MTKQSDITVPYPKRFMAPRLGAAIVLAVGLLLSLLLWQHAGQQVARDEQAQLDHRVALVLAGIQRSIEEYRSLLLGMQGDISGHQKAAHDRNQGGGRLGDGAEKPVDVSWLSEVHGSSLGAA